MRYFQSTKFCVVLAAAAVASFVRPASATVIFEDNFTTSADLWAPHQQVLAIPPSYSIGPQITNTGGAVYSRAPNLAPMTVGKIGYYGDQALDVRGLIFQPMDLENPQNPLAGTEGQTMHLPFEYQFGANPIRLTLKARQAVQPPTGLPFWNNFTFGFSDTDGNISNGVLLKRNSATNNINRAEIQLTHNSAEQGSKMYGRFYGGSGEGIRSDIFREFVLEYDPTKVNTADVSPYTFKVDGETIPWVHSSNGNVGSGAAVNLPPMTSNGGTGPSSIYGISWGFRWAHGDYDRSVMIESLKFEILDTPENDPGDFNGDGLVDGADFLKWQRGESTNGLSAGDLQEWKDNFVLGASPAATPIPEPASAGILAVGAAALLVARQRHRLK